MEWIERWAMLQVIGVYASWAFFVVALVAFIVRAVRDHFFVKCDKCYKWTHRSKIVQGTHHGAYTSETIWVCPDCAGRK